MLLASHLTSTNCNRVKCLAYPMSLTILGVSSLVMEYGGDEDEAIGALLHDAVEAPMPETIRGRFGDRVAEIVSGCSDSAGEPNPPWRVRKERGVQDGH
jgi:(p)ppGpp synthase/HD superfamily hydrolase